MTITTLESADQVLLECQLQSIKHAKLSLEQMLAQETDKEQAMILYCAIADLEQILKTY